jgi:hypothetical protein
MAMVFECQLGSMPFTYLGLAIGTIKPCVRDFSPIIDRIERRPSATVIFYLTGQFDSGQLFCHLSLLTSCVPWLSFWE